MVHGPYTYHWDNGSTTDSIFALSAGTYHVTITDAHGCTAVDSATLDAIAPILLNPVVVNIHCDTVGSITLNVVGGSGDYQYFWADGEFGASRDSLAVGTYYITVTDQNHCSVADSFKIAYIRCCVGPVALPDTAQTNENDSVLIGVLHNDYDTCYGFRIDTTTTPDHGHVVIIGDSINYTPDSGFVGIDSFTYTIIDSAGLTSTTTVIVIVLFTKPNVQIPNGFSPNGDGINDYFVITDVDKYPGSQLIVFNRWGNKVWQSDNYLSTWRGTDQNNQDLPDGTYYFVFTLNDGHGSKYEGFVTIHR